MQEFIEKDTSFIDAHTHVQFSGYDVDREAVIQRAFDADVRKIIVIGTQKDTSRAAVALTEKYPGKVYAAVGLHPVHTSRSFHDAQELGGEANDEVPEVFDMDYYRSLALDPRTVAIGECGLDYFHFNDDEPRAVQVARQKAALLAQIELSKEVKKPLMIHCRDAFGDFIEFVRPHAHDLAPGIVHFFTGTSDDARALLDLGFSFTFGGAITFPPRKGKSQGDYDEAIAAIPLDRILSETDAPYVAPLPYRGTRNEPAYVVHAVAKLAALKKVSVDEMRVQIAENVRRIFGV